jgi:hypothetical protein
MFAVAFAIMAVIALLSSCCEVAMRLRLTRRAMLASKLSWWMRGEEEVDAMYQEFFPHSRLPLLRQLAFGIFVTCALALVIFMIWKRS